MSSMQKEATRVTIPFWMAWFYGLMSLWLIPWILYLQCTLPEWQFSIPWRAMWVLFDLALFAVTLMATYFLRKKSLWASLTLTTLATLLIADAWFDTMTSSIVSGDLVTIVVDLCIEISLAIFSLWCAFYILRQAITPASKR